MTVGIIGNPNCGKSTLFNALTGSKQVIGNWPGVTVEKKEGVCHLGGTRQLQVVDLPGVYSLTATSEDERATVSSVLAHDADFFLNVIDATAFERNLYLTMLLCELKVPMMVAVTMMDIARERRQEIDLDHLSKHLGVPVIGINATNASDVTLLKKAISEFMLRPRVPYVPIEYPNELEQEIDILSSASIKTAEAMKVSPRWVAIKALEGDPLFRKALEDYHDMAPEVIDSSIARCREMLKDEPDIVLADSRYGFISGLVKDVVTVTQNKKYLSEKIDKFVINRFLGIPIFLGMMFVVFWFTQVVGGAFIDFFDIAGDTLFVGGTEYLLNVIHSPAWLTAIISHGVGTALQTVATFLPPVGFMFLALSILEDSGYMARAAFVMDRFMRWIGLPGKSFVPMLVGFGCSVPAIMATRALESKRDRFLTVFMVPFMSCGAKLPVWTLFAAAFLPDNPGKLVFMMYITGIVLGIVTGLIMKHTLFQGEPTHFIMELPPYHAPRPKHILQHTCERLSIFVWRAGKFIVPMVFLLGILNSIGVDGSIGNRDTDKSILASCGKAITPIFEPIGIERDNWQASVALFTGLFAKESVVGTMKGLYGQSEAIVEEPQKEYSLLGGLREACLSIPKNLSKIWRTHNEAEPVDAHAVDSLRIHFPKGYHQVFAFLLFVLLYVPCIAATGVTFREVGKLYGTIFVVYLTALGWSVATIYHAVMVSHSSSLFLLGLGIIAAMFTAFWLFGKHHRIDMP